jgi:hypothetical protein
MQGPSRRRYVRDGERGVLRRSEKEEGTVHTTHEMVLAGIAESGAEEWTCPMCDRRILLRWPPHHEMLVLDPGDETVTHIGARGGVRVGALELTPALPPVAESDRQWLHDNGIDWNDSPV